MIAYILFAVMTFFNIVYLILSKKFQVRTRFTVENIMQSNIACAVGGCLLAFVASGFSLTFTKTTLFYSAIFGFFSAISVLFMVYAYSHISIMLTSVVTNAGSIVIPLVFGLCFNNEKASVLLILAAILILCAAVIPFVKKGSLSGGGKFAWFLLLYFLFMGCNGVLSKLYAQSGDTSNVFVYLFMTNVFTSIISVVVIAVMYLKKKNTGDFVWITRHDFFDSALRAMIAVLFTALAIMILKIMPVSVYSVLTSGVGFTVNALVSSLFFKEKMSKVAKISFVLALASVIMVALV